MIKSYTNTKTISDIFKKPSNRSEIVSQMIYGENFFIIKKVNEWLKIKTKNDNYVGYIQNKNYSKQVNPTHKIISLRANIYKLPNKMLLVSCYHPSPRNVNTGRINEKKMTRLLKKVINLSN